MTGDGGILSAQTEAMIAQLRRFEAEQVGEILDGGHAGARAVVRGAYSQARASIRKAVERERRRRDAAALQARARSETRCRLDTQLRVARLLAMGWERLPAILAARWRDPAARRRWCQGALKQAGQRLLGNSFSVEHAPGPSPAELEAMGAACGDREVSFQAVAALTAGLRIRTDGACLDASAASLLADRGWLESLLLATLEDSAGGEVARDE